MGQVICQFRTRESFQFLAFVHFIFRKRCQNISTVVYTVNYHELLSSNQNGLLNYPIRIIFSKYSSALIKLKKRTNGFFIALSIQLTDTVSSSKAVSKTDQSGLNRNDPTFNFKWSFSISIFKSPIDYHKIWLLHINFVEILKFSPFKSNN